jgi:opacity protein-like surface antigen
MAGRFAACFLLLSTILRNRCFEIGKLLIMFDPNLQANQPLIMKKILFITAFLIAGVISANAQTEKGTLLLGGNISFQTADGASVFIATPSFGVFAWNNVAIGAQFTLVSSDGSSAWALGPFVKAYFAGSEKGKFFGQFGLNVGGGDNVDTEVGFSLGAGYAIFLNKSIAIDLGVNYTRAGDTDGIFGIGAGFQIHFKR